MSKSKEQNEVQPNLSILPNEDAETKKEDSELKPTIIQKRYYVSLPIIISSVDELNQFRLKYKLRRKRLIFTLLLLCASSFVSHLLIACIPIIHKFLMKKWEIEHSLPSAFMAEPKDIHFVTNCVTIYPKYINVEDWYIVSDLPYAVLPGKASIFSRSVDIHTFHECYAAFWLTISPRKKKFENGKLSFLGEESDDDNDICLQLEPSNKRYNSTSFVASCLTLSLMFRLGSAKGYLGKQTSDDNSLMPIIVYLGGYEMLYYKPRMISPHMARELNVVYAMVRYRLGIFGFSDFQLQEMGPNNAVEDVRKAISWLHKNCLMFGGNNNQITLYGENSGATIGVLLINERLKSSTQLMEKAPYLISRFWLVDGSLAISNALSDNGIFHKLLLTDIELASASKMCSMSQSTEQDYTQVRSIASGVSGRAKCLESAFSEKKWISKTPISWISAHDKLLNNLPHTEEESNSMLLEDSKISFVKSPLHMFNKRETDSLNIRDTQIIISSSLDQTYNYNSRHSKQLTEIQNISYLHQYVKRGLATFSTSTSQVNHAVELLKAYEPLINSLHQADDQTLAKEGFRPVLNAMISDLRAVCGWSFFAKQIQKFASSPKSSIYRILNKINIPLLMDKRGNICNLPFFLNDVHTGCQFNVSNELRASLRNQIKLFKSIIKKFSQNESIKELTLMQFSTQNDASAQETCFNILDIQGTTTSGAREVSNFAACKSWKMGSNGLDLFLKYGLVN